MRITATFIDEISHDIPHQNWGEKEWDEDFAAMQVIGIDTVVLIRCGWKRWMAFSSRTLGEKMNGYEPTIDLVDLFLRLAEKYGMKLFFGLYDSGYYWMNGDWDKEIAVNMPLVDEVWAKYGKYPAFGGWYLCQEVSRRTGKVIEAYAGLGRHCKEISGGLPILISPYIQGNKTGAWEPQVLSGKSSILPEDHEKEWSDILAGLEGVVDVVAFQDGHVDFFELSDYLEINRKLTDKFGMQCWTNCETFDREMPIKFLPLKWDKVLLKLKAAEKAGARKAITFEFSHFMSPNSCYNAAHGLYKRYCEHFGIANF
ncbi:MAG: DUF4434 domain-containing protein [Victivallaceae bacterium]